MVLVDYGYKVMPNPIYMEWIYMDKKCDEKIYRKKKKVAHGINYGQFDSWKTKASVIPGE